jgi:hypothetical protein
MKCVEDYFLFFVVGIFRRGKLGTEIDRIKIVLDIPFKSFIKEDILWFIFHRYRGSVFIDKIGYC